MNNDIRNVKVEIGDVVGYAVKNILHIDKVVSFGNNSRVNLTSGKSHVIEDLLVLPDDYDENVKE